MTLAAEEFIRRFLLHVLPRGFVRIRHYGLLASCQVTHALAQCSRVLPGAASSASGKPQSWLERITAWLGRDPRRCPSCRKPLERVAFEARQRPFGPQERICPSAATVDTS